MEEGGSRMNRRGVLGILGIGAAAGPAIAENIVSQAGNSSLDPKYISTANYKYDIDKGLVDKYAPDVFQENPLQRLNNVREQFNYLNDKKAWIDSFVSRELREIFRYGNYHNQVDPDIMAMKSFSMSAKIRMHIQRRAERRYDEDFSEVSEQLKYWMEKVGL
jgi:hypothetical protein